MPQFSETELTAAVIKSFDETPDPRAKFLLQELVKSLHDYVRRTDLTFAEWEYAIDFLTRTGQKCTPIRRAAQRIAGAEPLARRFGIPARRSRDGCYQLPSRN